MKKALFILCALAMFASCDNEGLEILQNKDNRSLDNEAKIEGDFNGLKLNLTITLDNGSSASFSCWMMSLAYEGWCFRSSSTQYSSIPFLICDLAFSMFIYLQGFRIPLQR